MQAPHFWSGGLDPKSRASAPLTRALLTPLAMVYSWAGARRIHKAKPHPPGVPVICIGNLTLGGAGKTPVAAVVREALLERGLRTAVLSRGYKGRLTGPVRVDGNSHSAADVGDEPLLLAQTGEAWVARDRLAGVKAMAASGIEAVVMDDGHQNPSVQKTLSLVVVDAGDPVGNGHVFPKGPLREPVARGLSRADAVIAMGEGFLPRAFVQSGVPVLRARLEPAHAPPAGPLVAFAGIGRPEKFFDALRQAGAEIVEDVPFPDHHAFTTGDLKYLHQLAGERGARLITTEKDFVRLAPSQREQTHAWPVHAAFEDVSVIQALLSRAVEARHD